MGYIDRLKKTLLLVCLYIIGRNGFCLLLTYFGIQNVNPIMSSNLYEMLGFIIGIIGTSLLLYKLEKKGLVDTQ